MKGSIRTIIGLTAITGVLASFDFYPQAIGIIQMVVGGIGVVFFVSGIRAISSHDQ